MATNKTDSMLTVDKDVKEMYKKVAKMEGMTIKYLARKLILEHIGKK